MNCWSEKTHIVPVEADLVPRLKSLYKVSSETSLKSGDYNFKSIIQVLIVDDSMLTRKLYKNILSKMNCECHEASNGKIAIEMCKIQKFSLILIDGNMPLVDGYEATRMIRKSGHTEIMVGCTGNALLDDIEKFTKSGVNHVLTKPLNVGELKRIVCEIHAKNDDKLLDKL